MENIENNIIFTRRSIRSFIKEKKVSPPPVKKAENETQQDEKEQKKEEEKNAQISIFSEVA